MAQQQQQMDDTEEHDSTPTDPNKTETDHEKRDLVKWSAMRSKYNCADGAKIELRRKTFTRYAEEDGQPDQEANVQQAKKEIEFVAPTSGILYRVHDSDYYQPHVFVSETEFNVELCDIARVSENIRTVIFPSTVRNILDGTFRHTHLRSVILSKGLKIIKPRCFHSSEIERIVIPKGVEEIQENAFYCCKNLKKVLLEEGSQLKVIGREVFMGCSGLTDIFLPDGLTEIGLRAFRESGL